MSLTVSELQARIAVQVGPLSPLRVLCDEKQKVEWADLPEQFDWQLLERLFSEPQGSFLQSEKELLSFYDQYLDLPLVQLVLAPSYAALRRILAVGPEVWVPSDRVFSVLDKESLCYDAAKKGHVEVLQWARSQGCPWNEWTCIRAIGGNQFEILKWAHARGCPWDISTCAVAASVGNLQILKWLKEHGCPWDENTTIMASKYGHFEILKWAYKNGCPIDDLICFYAAMHGDICMLR